MEGPLFSTQAESNLHRSWGASLIGMTALPEAKLAREAEMAYASICLATDYDVWFEEDHVNVSSVLENVKANVANVKAALRLVIEKVPLGHEETSTAHNALQYAVMTQPSQITDEAWDKVGLFLKKYIQR
jgi:5'-methylthioadenosine phosphorylase